MTLGLIADIGATNARFAICDKDGIRNELTLQCADHPTIVSAAQAYLAQVKPVEMPSVASFAIAGPVTGDWFDMTNHTWSFSQEETRKALGLELFHLMNDFKAIALGVPHITPEYLKKVGGGDAVPQAPIAILGPGTGLGVATLTWGGGRYNPNPGEGGHITMPAKTQREFDLFRTLRYKYSHVSAERVCSGKGLVNIYNAIRILDGHDAIPDRTPEEISAAALDKSCPVCVEALDKMMKFLGSTAGNLALSLGAFGGVYIAGGIPAKLGQAFHDSSFYEEFLAKGRFSDYLAPIPVYVIHHPYIAFVGLQADLFSRSAEQ